VPDTFDLIVLGDCNPDLLVTGAVDAKFGQVEQVVGDARLVIGGSAAITACGAARLGAQTALVGVVGDDFLGRFMLESVAERGVDVSGVAVDGDRPTGISVVLVRCADRAILTALGTIPELSREVVDSAMLRAARHVHVSSYFLQHRLRDELPELLADARSAGATVSIDPNWDPGESWDGGLREALRSADLLFANAEELRRIAGEDEVEAAASKLAELGPRVVVKLGADGAVAVRPGEVLHSSAPRVDVVDTVGAGDSFDAGFLAGFLSGRSAHESLKLACTCGSLSTRAAGGTAAQPTLAEALSV
jgi:sugar/nucleoside kinase (ribokinase family)